MFQFSSVKTQLILFLAAFAIYFVITEQNLVLLSAFSLSILSAALTDSIFSYFRDKKFSINESAVITGAIIGLVLSHREPWWIFVAAPVLGIILKHFFCSKKRPIFNPAAIGILLSMLIFEAQTAWTGTYAWPILVPAGLYFAYRIKKWEILASYYPTALLLFAGAAFIRRGDITDIFGLLSYFFISIMLIEPKTSSFTRKGKVIFGSGVAILIFLFTELGLRTDVELAALLSMNFIKTLMRKITNLD